MAFSLQLTQAAQVDALASLRAIMDNADAVFPAIHRRLSTESLADGDAAGTGGADRDPRRGAPLDSPAHDDFTDFNYWRAERSVDTTETGRG